MYNKENFAVMKITEKKSLDKRLSSVYFHPQYTLSTNTKSLMLVTAPKKNVNVEDMPAPKDGSKLTKQFKPFLLSVDDAKRVEKIIPQTIHALLNHAAVIDQLDNDKVKFYASDCSLDNVISCEKVNSEYYSIFEAFPRGTPKMTIRLDMDLLKDLLEAIKKAKGRSAISDIYIDLYGENKAIRFRTQNKETGQKVVALLQPMIK